MEISYNETPGETAVVAISGKIMLGPESEQITNVSVDLVKQGKRLIIFDISGVTAIDSTGLGRFISSFREISAAGGQMRIAGSTGVIRRAFHVCRLDTVFRFYDDVNQALGAA